MPEQSTDRKYSSSCPALKSSTSIQCSERTKLRNASNHYISLPLTIKFKSKTTGNSALCYLAAWMGGEFGGEWLHVRIWLSPSAVHLKLSQHC